MPKRDVLDLMRAMPRLGPRRLTDRQHVGRLPGLPSAEDPALRRLEYRVMMHPKARKMFERSRLGLPPAEMMGPTDEDRVARIAWYAEQHALNVERAMQVVNAGPPPRRACPVCGRHRKTFSRGLCYQCYRQIWRYARRVGRCRECNRRLGKDEKVCDTCFPRRYQQAEGVGSRG